MTSLMVTSGGGYGVLVRNWLQLGCNPGGTPGICPSELLRSREGTRADGWTDDRQQDGHSSVSPEDRDIYIIHQKRIIFTCHSFLIPLLFTCQISFTLKINIQ